MKHQTLGRWSAAVIMSAIAMAASGLATHANAQVDTASLIYIECEIQDGDSPRLVRGSGVLVGRDTILTAKHVGSEGECYAASGGGARPNIVLTGGRKSQQYDAMIMRLGQSIDADAVGFGEAKRGQEIDAWGVPLDDSARRFKVTRGSVTDNQPDANGALRTDALTVRGMSGGPVFERSSGALIGIVAGATFDPQTSQVTGFQVLAASEIAGELGLAAHVYWPTLDRSELQVIAQRERRGRTPTTCASYRANNEYHCTGTEFWSSTEDGVSLTKAECRHFGEAVGAGCVYSQSNTGICAAFTGDVEPGCAGCNLINEMSECTAR